MQVVHTAFTYLLLTFNSQHGLSFGWRLQIKAIIYKACFTQIEIFC